MPPTIISRNHPGSPHYIETIAGPWNYGGVTTRNSAFAAISAKADVLTRPATDLTAGRIVFQRPSGSLIELLFFGTNADGETFNYRVWRWGQVVEKNDRGLTQFTPHLVAAGAVTLSAKTGVSGGIITNTDFYADTVTDTSGRSSAGYALNAVLDGASTPDNSPMVLRIDPKADMDIEVEITRNGGTADSGGVLYRGLTSQ